MKGFFTACAFVAFGFYLSWAVQPHRPQQRYIASVTEHSYAFKYDPSYKM